MNVEQELSRFAAAAGGGGVRAVRLRPVAGRAPGAPGIAKTTWTTQAENNRIAVVPIVPNRGLIVDRNGVVLATNYSAYTLEITPSQGRRAGTADRRLAEVVEIQRATAGALQAPAGGEQELRVAADPHQADRRGGGALHGAALPLPGRGDQGAPVPQLSAGRDRQPPARLHRPHQPGREEAMEELGRRRQLPRHRVHRQAGLEQATRPSCTAHRLRGGRDQRRRPRGAAPASHPATPGNTWCCRSTSKLQALVEDLFGDRRGALVALDPAQRRGAGLRQQADLRPQPVRRRHRRRGWKS